MKQPTPDGAACVVQCDSHGHGRDTHSAAVQTIGDFHWDATFDQYLELSLRNGCAGDCYPTAHSVAACVVARHTANPDVTMAAAVHFIVNELLENAVKGCSGGDIQVAVGRACENLVCVVENPIESVRIPSLCEELAALVLDDPGELLCRRAERNAEGGGGSGLGLLSIMHDYGASVGWRLISETSDMSRLQTMVRLPINNR